MFTAYLHDDFVGADMARKFFQMGYTRARRYANYKGGRKYDQDNGYKSQERGDDPEKAESAAICYEYWKKAESEKRYAAQKRALERQHRMKLPILPIYYYHDHFTEMLELRH